MVHWALSENSARQIPYCTLITAALAAIHTLPSVITATPEVSEDM